MSEVDVARWSSGLSLRPLTPATRVRISYGSPFFKLNNLILDSESYLIYSANRHTRKVGVDCGEGPPVPIPNTEVKLTCAEDTWRAAAWENK